MKAIYCNNLSLSTDRYDMMSELFRQIGYNENVYRFDAFKGSMIVNKPMKLSPGKTGNILSHISIWKEIASKPDGFYMVMEDDLILADDLDPSQFRTNMEAMISQLPKEIGMIHCSRDINKFFVKNAIGKKITPSYKVVAHFGNKEVKKCSLTYPWSTETGAYMLRPSIANRLYKKGIWIVKYDKWLPYRNNVDLFLSRSIEANLSGAMVKLFTANTIPSVIDMINNRSNPAIDKQNVTFDSQFFERSSARIQPWFH